MKAIDRLTVIPEMMEASSVSPVCLSDSDDVPIKTEETFEDGNQLLGTSLFAMVDDDCCKHHTHSVLTGAMSGPL